MSPGGQLRLALAEWVDRHGEPPASVAQSGTPILAVRDADFRFWTRYEQWVVRDDYEPADVAYVAVTCSPIDVVSVGDDRFELVGRSGDWAFFSCQPEAVARALARGDHR